MNAIFYVISSTQIRIHVDEVLVLAIYTLFDVLKDIIVLQHCYELYRCIISTILKYSVKFTVDFLHQTMNLSEILCTNRCCASINFNKEDLSNAPLLICVYF